MSRTIRGKRISTLSTGTIRTTALSTRGEGISDEDWQEACVILTQVKKVRQILEGLGIAHYFSVVYGGDSFPAKKPDPAGVHKILEQFKVSPSNTLFIGDSEVDVQTARNAGTIAVTVNHGFGQHDRATHPADLYVDRLGDLAPLLQKV